MRPTVRQRTPRATALAHTPIKFMLAGMFSYTVIIKCNYAFELFRNSEVEEEKDGVGIYGPLLSEVSNF